jgi:hypothetical protein
MAAGADHLDGCHGALSRLSRTYQVMGPAMQRPLVLGLAFAVGTAVWLGWLVRRWSDFPRAERSFWSKMLTVWGSGILLAFVLTHTRYPIPATELTVTTVVYLTKHYRWRCCDGPVRRVAG